MTACRRTIQFPFGDPDYAELDGDITSRRGVQRERVAFANRMSINHCQTLVAEDNSADTQFFRRNLNCGGCRRGE